MKKRKKHNNSSENGEDCRSTAEQSEEECCVVEMTYDDGLAMDDLTIEEGLTRVFLTIGISPNLKGYVYLKSAVRYVMRNHVLIYGLTKKLYPKIAKEFSSNGMTVERAMRHAIESAWNRGREESIKSVFGARSYVCKERPTTGEFIALVAEKLIDDWRQSVFSLQKEESENASPDDTHSDDDNPEKK